MGGAEAPAAAGDAVTHDEAEALVWRALGADPACAQHMESTRRMLGIVDPQGRELVRWEPTAERVALLRFRSDELASLIERWRRSRGQA